MARVSLILPTSPDQRPIASRIGPWRLGLERAGHEVEVLIVGAEPDETAPCCRGVESEGPGLSAAAITGLRQAHGDVLLVLDPGLEHNPDHLIRVIGPLIEGQADLAIATGGVEGPAGAILPRRGPLRTLARTLLGTSAPMSGLVGLTRAALDRVRDDFRPAGGTFAFDLLARVGGRWVEVPIVAARSRRRRRPGVDDLRQLKRLADLKFGNASRLIQFCAVGGSGMLLDLSFYFALQPIFALTPLATANVPPSTVSWALFASRSLAIGLALVWNFSLNRRLTFSYARGGSAGRQFVTYALSNAPGVALSLATSLGLPSRVPFFRAHKLAAAVVGIVLATGISFTMSRWVVFQGRDGSEPSSGRRPRRSKPPRGVECAATLSAPSDGF